MLLSFRVKRGISIKRRKSRSGNVAGFFFFNAIFTFQMSKSRIKYFSLLFLGAISFISYAQKTVLKYNESKVVETPVLDSLKSILKTLKDDTNKVKFLNKISKEYILLDKYDSALSYGERAQVLATKNKFNEGIADALRDIGVICFNQNNYKKALEHLLESLTICQQIENKVGIGDNLDCIGFLYMKLGDYPKALEYDFKALNIAQEVGNKSNMAKALLNIGNEYSEQENYSMALEYLRKALNINEEIGNKANIDGALNVIGTCYAGQHNDQKALEYYSKSLRIGQEIDDKAGVVGDLINIGDVYDMEGNYNEAIKYDSKALSIIPKIGDKDLNSSLYSNMGHVYTKLKKYKQAKIFLDSALIIAKSIADKRIIQYDYCYLSELDSAIGNHIASYADYKQYIIYRDSINSQENIKKIAQMESNRELQRVEDSIKMEEKKARIIQTSEINRKRIVTDSIIVILVLLVLLAILLVNRQQIKRKKDKLVYENKTNLLLLKKQETEFELSKAKTMLDEYIKSMVEKNNRLEQITTDLEELKNLKAREIDENRIERLEDLSNITILTDEDWNKFRQLFEQVYKGFFIRLKEKLPDLSPAEIRLFCLIKLQLGTKQMAGILGVSFLTIKKTRYRLRKKLQLSDTDNLDDFIASI